MQSLGTYFEVEDALFEDDVLVVLELLEEGTPAELLEEGTLLELLEEGALVALELSEEDTLPNVLEEDALEAPGLLGDDALVVFELLGEDTLEEGTFVVLELLEDDDVLIVLELPDKSLDTSYSFSLARVSPVFESVDDSIVPFCASMFATMPADFRVVFLTFSLSFEIGDKRDE